MTLPLKLHNLELINVNAKRGCCPCSLGDVTILPCINQVTGGCDISRARLR